MIRTNHRFRRPLTPQTPGQTDHRSDEICKRLARIEGHYAELIRLLGDLETRLPMTEAPLPDDEATLRRRRKPR